MSLRKIARVALTAYVSQIALLNGVSAAEVGTTRFAIEPTVSQTLVTKIQESSDFLKSINVVEVPEQEGERIGLTISTPVSSRTDTSGDGTRKTTDPSGMESHKYRCEKTNHDTHISYAKIDAWAKFNDFQSRIRDLIVQSQARDRIMIGWNGVAVATTTNKTANPLLQDVNKGWLYQIRTNASTRVLDDGNLTSGATKAIYVADGVEVVNADATNTGSAKADYVNLDALVYDAVSLLDPWAQDDTGLVVIVGRDLLHDKYFPMVNAAGEKATEQEARDRILRSDKQIGGLPAVRVPAFPAGTILITRLDNLSIYFQEGTRRRQFKEVAERDRFENYESWNEAYVIEDYGYCALIENIKLGKKPA
ncbi:MAG: phage major capsid protein, P2 family [Rhizorhabdus sp.]